MDLAELVEHAAHLGDEGVGTGILRDPQQRREGKVRYHYNYFGLARYDMVAGDALTPGEHTIASVTFVFGEFDEPSGMDRLELATKMD